MYYMLRIRVNDLHSINAFTGESPLRYPEPLASIAFAR